MGLLSKMKEAQAQASAAMPSMPAALGGDLSGQMSYAQLANRLGQVGVETPAVVDTIAPTGRTEMGGSQSVAFGATIAPAGGAPYATTITQSMLPAQLEGIHTGAAVTVKVDPSDPSAALIYGW